MLPVYGFGIVKTKFQITIATGLGYTEQRRGGGKPSELIEICKHILRNKIVFANLETLTYNNHATSQLKTELLLSICICSQLSIHV